MRAAGEHWLEVLRSACEDSSQTAVARQLGVSVAMVNQVLKGTYKGNVHNLRVRVEATLPMQVQMVDCPVADHMTRQKCREYQNRDPNLTWGNPILLQFYRACRSGCPHSKLPKEY
ncbi:transcriptional regulator [Candidatus Competibacter denitrificans]|nr:transcriptional regulator [Candidatus Competibacter denitrificans]